MNRWEPVRKTRRTGEEGEAIGNAAFPTFRRKMFAADVASSPILLRKKGGPGALPHRHILSLAKVERSNPVYFQHRTPSPPPDNGKELKDLTVAFFLSPCKFTSDNSAAAVWSSCCPADRVKRSEGRERGAAIP